MTYGGFQRLSEASAYSKMRCEQKIELETQERKEILDKCEIASNKVNEGDEKGTEELFQALQKYHDLRDLQDKNND